MELNISLNELLSGEKDNKKAQKNEATIYFLRCFKEKNKILLLISIITIIFILFVSALFIYFINNYNKFKVYSLSGESENFVYNEGLFIDTNQEYFYTFGQLSHNKSSLDLNILKISLKNGEELIFEDQYRLGGYLSELKGYNEIFTEDKVKKIDNWTLEITYLDKDSNIEKKEKIKLKNEVKLKSNNFFSKKVKAIGRNFKSDTVTSSIIAERKNSLEKLQNT